MRENHQHTLIDTPVPVRVNRRRKFRCLADKAWAQNYLWRPPLSSDVGLFPKVHPSTGEITGYRLCTAERIHDVDGVEKAVMKTVHLDAEQHPTTLKTEWGHRSERGTGFHGKHSRHWKHAELSPRQVVEALTSGYSVAPALFEPNPASPHPKERSHRSQGTVVRAHIVMLDADVWSDDCPAPHSINELIERYPSLPDTFAWMGESISSRSALKPDMRFRLLMMLPEPLTYSDVDRKAWECMVSELTAQYPFIDGAVGSDISRLSYGNARPECQQRWLNETGHPSISDVHRWKAEGAAMVAAELAEKERRATQSQARHLQRIRTGITAPTTGNPKSSDGDSPLKAFYQTDITTLLERIHCTHNGGGEWHYPNASSGRSFIVNGGGSDAVIAPFSSTVKDAMPPNADKNSPINAHRFVLYHEYGTDIVDRNPDELERLNERLGSDGYGTYTPSDKKAGSRRRERKPVLKRAISDNGDAPPAPAPPSVEAVRKLLPPDLRVWLADDTADKKRFLAVRVDTGVGKTTTVVSETEDLLFVAPHTQLADEAFAVSEEHVMQRYHAALAAAEKAGEFTDDIAPNYPMRWRARHFGFKEAVTAVGGQLDFMSDVDRDLLFDEGAMCAYADVAERLQQKGYDVVTALCKNCHLIDECRNKGYLRQHRDAPHHKHIMIALPELELIANPHYQSWADSLNSIAQRTAVIDDCMPENLAPRTQLSLMHLKRLSDERCEDWLQGQQLSFQTAQSLQFLAEMRAVIVEDTSDVEFAIEDLIDTVDIAAIRKELGRVPFYFTVDNDGTVRDAQHTDNTYPKGTFDDSFHKRQRGRIHREFLPQGTAYHFGILNGQSILTVVDELKGWVSAMLDKNTAVRRIRDDNGYPALEFVMKPRLNFTSTIALSATANTDDYRKVLGDGVDVSELTAPTPAWKSDCKVYQLNTARYTDASFFTLKAGKIAGAGPRLSDVVSLVLGEIAAGKKVLLVGRKALQSEALSDVMQPLWDASAMCAIHNYGEIVGRNDYSDYDTVLLMLPTPGKPELERAAASLYRDTFWELDFDSRTDGTVTMGEFSIDMEVYSDGRVQAIAQHVIQHKLYQAAMRLRPIIGEDKAIMLLTAYPIDGLTNRPDTVLCSMKDALRAPQIRAINPPPTLQDIRDTSDTVKAAAEAAGVSERQVYRETAKATKQSKADRDAKIHEMATLGCSARDISKATGIPRSTVTRVMKER